MMWPVLESPMPVMHPWSGNTDGRQCSGMQDPGNNIRCPDCNKDCEDNPLPYAEVCEDCTKEKLGIPSEGKKTMPKSTCHTHTFGSWRGSDTAKQCLMHWPYGVEEVNRSGEGLYMCRTCRLSADTEGKELAKQLTQVHGAADKMEWRPMSGHRVPGRCRCWSHRCQ